MKRVSPETSAGFCVTTASALAALVAAVAATAIATAAAVATISGTGAGSSLATAIFIAAVLAAAASGLLASCIAGPPIPMTEASTHIVLPLTTIQDGLKTLERITKCRSPRPIRRRPQPRRRPIPEEPRPTPAPVKPPSPSAALAFHERCGRILETCDLLVRHFPATRTLCILRTAEGIIARRPHRIFEPEPTWESDIDVDLDPVLTAPNLDEALRRLDQSIRSARKYKESNERLRSTSLVLEVEKRRNIRSSEQYLVDDTQTPAIKDDVDVDEECIPKPKARSSLLHLTDTDSSHQFPSPETNEKLSEEANALIHNTEDFSSSQNDVLKSFVEMNSESIPTSESMGNYTDSSILNESDIPSSSCVKETENIALSSTLTENNAEDQPEDVSPVSTLLENEPLLSIAPESKIISSSCEKEAESTTLSALTENEEVVSSAEDQPENGDLRNTESEAVLSSSEVEAENQAPSPVSPPFSTSAETEALNKDTLLIAEAVISSYDSKEVETLAHSSILTEKEAVSSSSVSIDTENMPVISTEAEDSPHQTESVLSSSEEILTDDTDSFIAPISERQGAEAAVSECFSEAENLDLLDKPIGNNSVSTSETQIENSAINDVPLPDAESPKSDDLISADFSVHSDTKTDDSYITRIFLKEAEDRYNKQHPKEISSSKQTEISSPPVTSESHHNLTLDLDLADTAPSNIDKEFEKLLETISPAPNDDIDKTFSAVSSDISGLDETISEEKNYLPDTDALLLDQSKPEGSSDDGRLSSRVEETSIDRTTLSEDLSEILKSDIKSFPDLDTRPTYQEGSDYAEESTPFNAGSLLDTNSDIEKKDVIEDINDSLAQFTSKNQASNLQPVAVFFDVLNSMQGVKTEGTTIFEETNEAAVQIVELHSASLNERETNFDCEIQSFIKDDSSTEVINDCASDSSSMSVSPNPDISFFRTETNFAAESCQLPDPQLNVKKIDENLKEMDETAKRKHDDLKKMDEFGFGEPLMVVTARRVKTYVDDAEQFQKRLERKNRRLRIYPEDISEDSGVRDEKPVFTRGVARTSKEPESSHCFEPVSRPRGTDSRKREVSQRFCEAEPSTENPEKSPCSDALPGNFSRSLERREGRRLSTYDHSSAFPINTRVPRRRAIWDNKQTESKCESPEFPIKPQVLHRHACLDNKETESKSPEFPISTQVPHRRAIWDNKQTESKCESPEFPISTQVPHRRAIWDNKQTESKCESPKFPISTQVPHRRAIWDNKQKESKCESPEFPINTQVPHSRALLDNKQTESKCESPEFPISTRVPDRRAFWDNKVTESKCESPKRQPSIKVTGIVQKCKETLQTLSGSSECLSTVAIDEEELPRNHRKKFQEAKCFFQNLEGKGKAQSGTPLELEKPEALEKPRGYPATVEERFNVTGIYRDVLGDGAAKTAVGAPLRGVPRRKAVIATLDSFRK